PRLAEEALDYHGVGGVEAGELLQRHRTRQIDLTREVDDCRAATSDLPQDLVPSDPAQDPLVVNGEWRVAQCRSRLSEASAEDSPVLRPSRPCRAARPSAAGARSSLLEKGVPFVYFSARSSGGRGGV